MGQRHLLLSLLLACALGVQAGELRLVTGDDYAPFTDRKLPGGGLLTQVVMAALAEQQQTARLDWRPWMRGYKMAQAAEYDGTFPYIRTPEREADFLYSEPLYRVQQHIFSRSNETYEPEQLSALRGKRFCYPLGWQPPKALQEMVERGELTRHEPSGLDECARLLLLRRDDFFVADARLGETSLQLSGAARDQFHRSEGIFPSNALHLLIPRRHPQAHALLNEFNRGLASLHSSGRYQKLLEQFVQ